MTDSRQAELYFEQGRALPEEDQALGRVMMSGFWGVDSVAGDRLVDESDLQSVYLLVVETDNPQALREQRQIPTEAFEAATLLMARHDIRVQG